MIESVTVNLSYSADDYARATLFIARRKWWVRYLLLLVVAAVWTLFGLAYLFSTGSFRETLSTNLLVLVIASTMILLGGLFTREKTSNRSLRRRFQKQIDSSPLMQETQTLTFSNNGISSTQVLGTGDITWNAVIEVIETKWDYFFFTAKESAIFIPKHALLDDRQGAQLRAIIHEGFGDGAKLLQ
ncbi:MAG TPA: YcxB family protein [Pyrinomonadaceae bacterium]|nr:YcxB family protein [Pyrinomonadaceae bacterium]